MLQPSFKIVPGAEILFADKGEFRVIEVKAGMVTFCRAGAKGNGRSHWSLPLGFVRRNGAVKTAEGESNTVGVTPPEGN